MVPIFERSVLANPLVTSIQLEASASQLDGVPKDLEDSIRFETARLLQAAGTLLRLPQELIAQSTILLYRYWTGADGGSLLEHDSKDVAAACLYLTAKPSPHPLTAKQVLVVFEFLGSIRPDYSTSLTDIDPEKSKWSLSEGQFESARHSIYQIESSILRVLGFDTHVALPYTLCINYLQTLDLFKASDGSMVAKRCFAHLNNALLSSQVLYLTHQPSAIVTAAIYLAAREVDVKLPENEWWEVFDVDREELGFLVVALRSVDGFAQEEKRKWTERRIPLTVEEVQAEIKRMRPMDGER